MENTIPTTLKKTALIYSLIWGGVNITLFTLIYYTYPQFMGSFIWSGLQLIIGLSLSIIFILKLRKQVGGFWTFREAVSHIFILFIVQAVTVLFYTIIFARYIEPEYMSKMQDIVLPKLIKMMEEAKAPQKQIDQTVTQAIAALEKQLHPSIKELFFNLTTVIIMYFIGSLIFAAIFKRNPPPFTDTPEQDIAE